MGKIDVRTGSAIRVLSADSPQLREAVFEAGFGSEGGLGVEIEFLAFEHGNSASLGAPGATVSPGAFIERLHAAAGPEASLDRDPLNGYPCGVTLPSGARFCLENGGQIEYASACRSSLDQVAAELADALALCEAAAEGAIGFLSHGTHPTLEARLDPLVPNSRYRIMEHFFAPDSIHKWGNYASSIQVNLDVPDPIAWHDALPLGFALSRFAYAMFANSAFLHGRPFDGASARLELMKGMDPTRRHPGAAGLAGADPVEAYVQWALDASVIFAGDFPIPELPRRGELSFRAWLEDGYRGTYPRLEDWKLHLGTLWPDVRPRRFIELRANDAQPFPFVMAVVAFWQALIQRPEGHAAAWQVLAALPGAGETRESALLNVLERAYDDALFADPHWHAAWLQAAATTLDAEAPRWASAVRHYARFLTEKPRYWGTGGPERFLTRAVSAAPAAELTAFDGPAGKPARAETGRLVAIEEA